MNTFGGIRRTLEGLKCTEGVMCRICKDIMKHTPYRINDFIRANDISFLYLNRFFVLERALRGVRAILHQ